MQTRRVAILIGEQGSAKAFHAGIAAFARHHPAWEVYPLWSSDPGQLRELPEAPHGVIAGAYRPETVRQCRDLPMPVVNIMEMPEPPLTTVCPDNAAGATLAAEHLIGLGVRSLCFFGHGPNVGPDCQIRCDALVAAAAEADLPGYVADFEYPYRWQAVEAFREKVGAWLGPMERPIGVLAFNDRLGARLATAAMSQGLRVPDEVAVVGFDNAELECLCGNPPLTSVDTNRSRVGYEAARVLDDILSGACCPDSPIRVPPLGVVERGSTDVIAYEDELVVRAVRFIRDRATTDISAADVYAATHASRATVQPRFRKLVGRTVSEEIWHERLRHGRTLLAETDLPLADVAERCGFASMAHFCRRFRSETGETPTSFRRRRSFRASEQE